VDVRTGLYWLTAAPGAGIGEHENKLPGSIEGNMLRRWTTIRFSLYDV